MTTASEVADKLAKTIKSLLNYEVISRQDSENMSAVVQEIAQALTAFAGEGVAEALEDAEMKEQIQHNFYMIAIEQRYNARAEALEEAADIANEWINAPSCHSHDDDPCCHKQTAVGYAEKIRALGEKP
jgi:hypothetical protein